MMMRIKIQTIWYRLRLGFRVIPVLMAVARAFPLKLNSDDRFTAMIGCISSVTL